ncbi:MAG: DUF4190 domain-containing protein [Candidatus Hydrogenedentes bacterium]|nr:DUF4190 domain-containing protein [Candidatus Hydrogenedentota bacterium]
MAGPPPFTKTSGLAIASLVLGLLGLFTCGLTAIPGLICGILAVVYISRSGGRLTGQGLAIGGLVVSAVFLLVLPISAAIMRPALARAREAARRASCQNNLKQMGIVCKMFANESKGEVFPELAAEAGRLMFVSTPVYPEFLSDSHVLLCPSDPMAPDPRFAEDPVSAVDDQSYFYLGYVIVNDDELAAFAEVYKDRVAQGLKFDEDLPAPPGRGSMGGNVFYRVREGVERIDGAELTQAEIPVMWDRFSFGPYAASFNHVPGGSNVLFMDGHIEFVRYPGRWPLTRAAGEILTELDELRP